MAVRVIPGVAPLRSPDRYCVVILLNMFLNKDREYIGYMNVSMQFIDVHGN